MAKAYAGVLGSLAMAVVMARGAISGAGVEGTATTAVVATAALGLVGLLVGRIAEATVDSAVRDRLQRQIDQQNSTQA